MFDRTKYIVRGLRKGSTNHQWIYGYYYLDVATGLDVIIDDVDQEHVVVDPNTISAPVYCDSGHTVYAGDIIESLVRDEEGHEKYICTLVHPESRFALPPVVVGDIFTTPEYLLYGAPHVPEEDPDEGIELHDVLDCEKYHEVEEEGEPLEGIPYEPVEGPDWDDIMGNKEPPIDEPQE